MSTEKSPEVEPVDTGHDYDGIREYDNHLPNWWLATLFLTLIFGYGYWLYYRHLGGPSSQDEYRAELDAMNTAALARAKAKGGLNDEALVAMSGVSAKVQVGEATFRTTCAACHGDKGQGVIGPNLTDKAWIHGGKPTDILHTVTAGVTDKGMPAWGPVLGEEKVESVVAYLLTVKNTNVPGKAPQGELAAE